jgi:hypothetical protein
MPPAAITGIGGGPALATGGPYSPECVEEKFSEVHIRDTVWDLLSHPLRLD